MIGPPQPRLGEYIKRKSAPEQTRLRWCIGGRERANTNMKSREKVNKRLTSRAPSALSRYSGPAHHYTTSFSFSFFSLTLVIISLQCLCFILSHPLLLFSCHSSLIILAPRRRLSSAYLSSNMLMSTFSMKDWQRHLCLPNRAMISRSIHAAAQLTPAP